MPNVYVLNSVTVTQVLFSRSDNYIHLQCDVRKKLHYASVLCKKITKNVYIDVILALWFKVQTVGSLLWSENWDYSRFCSVGRQSQHLESPK